MRPSYLRIFYISFLEFFYCGESFQFVILRWKDIGFSPDGIVSGIGKGLFFGLVCSVFAYTVECIVLLFLHGNVHLSFYASGFSLTNDKVSQAGILLILSSVLFNLINVWMEEGVFRGLFTKILEGISYRKSLFL